MCEITAGSGDMDNKSEKFVPYGKMSKKEKKALNSKKRKDWSVFNMWLSGHQVKKKKDDSQKG